MADIVFSLAIAMLIVSLPLRAGQFRRVPPPPAAHPQSPQTQENSPGSETTPDARTHPDSTPGAPVVVSGEESAGFVIRQDVRLVRADVQVTEKDRVVRGLSASDFTVLDDGMPVPIAGFGEESDPVDLLMLLDVSGSMTSYLYEVSRAAGVALEQLTPDDRVGVMVFSKQGKLLNALTKNRPDVLTTLRSLTRLPGMAAGTGINASIMDAVKSFKDDAAAGNYDPRHRRAILILTDNWGLNYKLPDRLVLRSLHEENISLHAIVVGRVQKPKGKWAEADDDLAEELDFTPANVFRLADDTGGDIFTNLSKDGGLAEILGRIRTRYSLYFKPSAGVPAGSYRKIEVKLAGAAAREYRKATVRARAGYFTK